jgi:hypothetical protein
VRSSWLTCEAPPGTRPARFCPWPASAFLAWQSPPNGEQDNARVLERRSIEVCSALAAAIERDLFLGQLQMISFKVIQLRSHLRTVSGRFGEKS